MSESLKGEVWDPLQLDELILDIKTWDNPINRVTIEHLNQKSSITRELVTLLASHTPTSGLKELSLAFWQASEENLGQQFFDSLTNMCPEVQKLKVVNMYDLGKEERGHLTQMVAEIVKNSQATLKSIDLYRLSKDKASGKEEGTVILDALCSNIPTEELDYFGCGANPSWWRNERNLDLLCDFLGMVKCK